LNVSEGGGVKVSESDERELSSVGSVRFITRECAGLKTDVDEMVKQNIPVAAGFKAGLFSS
jgi:hypothetical protein